MNLEDLPVTVLGRDVHEYWNYRIERLYKNSKGETVAIDDRRRIKDFLP